MKKFILLTLLFGSCSHAKITGVPTRDHRQCWFPVDVRLDSTIPTKKAMIIARGFKYWNEVLEKEVFSISMDTNMQSNPQEVYLPVTHTDEDDGWCGLTMYNIIADSCVYKNSIIFATHGSCFDDGILESVARHEAGHALGLGHSKSEHALMYYRVNGKVKHPQGATAEEIGTAKSLATPFYERIKR